MEKGKQSMREIVVIGGGAAGLPLSLLLSRKGRKVLVLEKNDRVGRKLLATGNGRCNLANADFSLSHYHGSLVPYLSGLFQTFGPDKIRAFWESIGIDYLQEGDRFYPRSLQASSVVNSLRRFIDQSALIEVKTHTRVIGITPFSGGFEIEAREKSEDGGENTVIYRARQVCVCMGGKASYSLGADGDGARMAKKLGIPVTPLRPGICRLILSDPYLKRLAGLKIDAKASLYADSLQGEAKGEILFTKEGISGPAVLDLSRLAGDLLSSGKAVRISVDLMPELSAEALMALLKKRCERLGDFALEEALEGLLHNRIIGTVIEKAALERRREAGKLLESELFNLIDQIKDLRFQIASLDSFKEAQITVGGVSSDGVTKELESKRYPGLFFAGEVLDADGDCGGYNLMFAVASAMQAAEQIAKQNTRHFAEEKSHG